MPHDLRTESPRLLYEHFTPAAPADPTGDVGARLSLRAAELGTTAGILDALLRGPLSPGAARPSREPAPLGVGRVECARGATTCAVELDDRRERIRRVHLRTASYANWPALAHAAAGNLIPDFPLINKSFELCYACVDR